MQVRERRAASTFTKRSLIDLSYAIEESLLGNGDGEPYIVIGLFQQGTYLRPQCARYEAFAQQASAVVVAAAGLLEVPRGCEAIELEPDEPLVGEWALVVLGPRVGMSIVATDRWRVNPGEASFEDGRLFEARWSARREVAAEEAMRLLRQLGDRVDTKTAELIKTFIRSAMEHTATPAEMALGVALDNLVPRLEKAHSARRDMGTKLDFVQRLAESDPLTGLSNRAFLDRFLREARQSPSPSRMGVVLIDLDGFKAINDTFGHAVGDAAIAAVATALQQAMRPGDVVIRWGGDEFLILLPGLPADALQARAERLLAAVADTHLPAPHAVISLEASAGCAGMDPHGDPMAMVDAALYAAKAAGGGRAVSADADDPHSPVTTLAGHPVT